MKKKHLLFLMFCASSLLVTAQNVGIGTMAPVARLHVTDSAVLFSGTETAPPSTTTINPPAQGAGTRMMWFPALGAFRAGYVDGVQWDRDSIGSFSFAAGNSSKASGKSSISMGAFTTASGEYATSMGFGALASNITSISLGNGTIASGISSISMGTATIAQGNGSVSIGNSNTASGLFATSIGYATSAIGNYSTSIGTFTKSKAYGGFAIGLYNDTADSPSLAIPINTDRVFQIGNGTSFARSNAITVLRNGYTGIGTVSPGFPLNFPNNLGDKISLYGNSGAHYGFGIQGSLLQVHAAGFEDDIGFGFGSSSSFTERARIINNGEIGMQITGRLRLKTGTESAGVWLNNAANSASAFLGLQTDSTVGLYGNGGSGWGLVMKTTSGNIGIGTSGPGFPLNFPNNLGDKISLYGNSGAHYGFGIQGSLLQVHSAGSADDIGFGYGSSSAFTERVRIINSGEIGMQVTGRLRLKTGTESAGVWFNNAANSARAFVGLQTDTTVGFYGNNGSGWGFLMNTQTGALSMAGSAGKTGQVLTNNGASSAASWASATRELYNNTIKIQGSSNVYIDQGFTFIDVPGLTSTFTITANAKVLIHHNVYANSVVCSGCGGVGNGIDLQLFVNGTGLGMHKTLLPFGNQMTLAGVSMTTLTAGTYTVNVKARASGALGVWFGTAFSDYINNIIIQIIPQ